MIWKKFNCINCKRLIKGSKSIIFCHKSMENKGFLMIKKFAKNFLLLLCLLKNRQYNFCICFCMLTFIFANISLLICTFITSLVNINLLKVFLISFVVDYNLYCFHCHVSCHQNVFTFYFIEKNIRISY